MIRKYPVHVWQEENGDWLLTFADAPINIVEPTLSQALAECQAAFETGFADEDALPEPSPLDAAMLSENGRQAASTLLVDIDTTFFSDPTERKSTSAKRSQWLIIDQAARKEGKTRSAYMVDAAVGRAKGLAGA